MDTLENENSRSFSIFITLKPRYLAPASTTHSKSRTWDIWLILRFSQTVTEPLDFVCMLAVLSYSHIMWCLEEQAVCFTRQVLLMKWLPSGYYTEERYNSQPEWKRIRLFGLQDMLVSCHVVTFKTEPISPWFSIKPLPYYTKSQYLGFSSLFCILCWHVSANKPSPEHQEKYPPPFMEWIIIHRRIGVCLGWV